MSEIFARATASPFTGSGPRISSTRHIVPASRSLRLYGAALAAARACGRYGDCATSTRISSHGRMKPCPRIHQGPRPPAPQTRESSEGTRPPPTAEASSDPATASRFAWRDARAALRPAHRVADLCPSPRRPFEDRGEIFHVVVHAPGASELPSQGLVPSRFPSFHLGRRSLSSRAMPPCAGTFLYRRDAAAGLARGLGSAAEGRLSQAPCFITKPAGRNRTMPAPNLALFPDPQEIASCNGDAQFAGLHVGCAK